MVLRHVLYKDKPLVDGTYSGEKAEGLSGGMSIAEETKIPVGTIKAGQYLEEPSHLTWTTQKPTAPGLYGYRKSRVAKSYVVDVELKNGTLTVDNTYADRCRGPVATIEGDWAGPLLPPK